MIDQYWNSIGIGWGCSDFKTKEDSVHIVFVSFYFKKWCVCGGGLCVCVYVCACVRMFVCLRVCVCPQMWKMTWNLRCQYAQVNLVEILFPSCTIYHCLNFRSKVNLTRLTDSNGKESKKKYNEIYVFLTWFPFPRGDCKRQQQWVI